MRQNNHHFCARRCRWLAGALVLWPTGVISPAVEPDGSARPQAVAGITTPSRQATLSSVQPGRLTRIAATEGTIVKTGDLVFALDDSGQESRALMAEAGAASTLDIELAQARWEQAHRDLERIQLIADSSGQDFASRKELSDALSAERIRGVELRIARFVHEQDKQTAQLERRTLEQFRAVAPFDGYVTRYLKELGETVNESEPVVTLAQLDPLTVPLDCPLHLAPALKVGDRVRVRPADDRWPVREGVVSFASRVGDGGSQTFRVEVTVDNADQLWIAGIKVAAEFNTGDRPAARSSDAAADRRGP
jgi:RND family efflux transporter MFP subunit